MRKSQIYIKTEKTEKITLTWGDVVSQVGEGGSLPNKGGLKISLVHTLHP